MKQKAQVASVLTSILAVLGSVQGSLPPEYAVWALLVTNIISAVLPAVQGVKKESA